MAKNSLIKPNSGLTEILMDERVLGSALGVGVEWAAEKALYSANRKAFGYADQNNKGEVVFSETKGGAPSPQMANNRLMAKLAMMIAGTLVMVNAEQESFAYFGLGWSSAALTHVVQHHILRVS